MLRRHGCAAPDRRRAPYPLGARHRGSATVGDVHEALEPERSTGYTTVLELMPIVDKEGVVVRDNSQRRHVCTPPIQRADRRITRLLRRPSKRRRPTRMAAAFALLLAIGTAVCVTLAIRHMGSPRDGTTISIAWLPKRVRAFEPQIVAAATRHGLDPDLLAIIVMIESSGDPDARSPVGATGLMQVMPSTATDIARARGLPAEAATVALEDPAHNLDFGAWYFAQQLRRFADHGESAVELAAAAYNGGPARVQAFLQGRAQLSEETVRYRELVRALWNERTLARSPTLERVRGG